MTITKTKTTGPSKAEIIDAYEKGDESQKKLLVKLFPHIPLSNDIRDKVKTLADAIKITGIKKDAEIMALLNYKGADELMIAARTFVELSIIIQALNEGWVPDFSNSNEYKWYVYMKHVAGSGLAYYDVDYWITSSNAGARLALKSRELGEYAGQQFENKYKIFFTLNKS